MTDETKAEAAMDPPDPTDSREWWREIWQFARSWDTCTRCGVRILKSHLDGGVCRDRAECDATLARRPCPWCGEVHETETIRLRDMEVTTCPKLGTQDAVMFAIAQEQNPVATVRLKDGSQVVAHAPAGLEVRVFGAEDLDESGMPRWLK